MEPPRGRVYSGEGKRVSFLFPTSPGYKIWDVEPDPSPERWN